MNKEDVLKHLREIIKEQEISPDEFSLADYCEVNGCGMTTAKKDLFALVKRGEVTARKLTRPTSKWVFRRVETAKKK